MNLRGDVALYYRTKADEWFMRYLIPLGTERPLVTGAQRQVETFINNELLTAGGTDQRQRGAGVLFLLPVADVEEPNIPGPLLDPFWLPALIFENPELNYGRLGTNQPAENILARYLAIHHQFTRQGLTSGAIRAGRNTIAALPAAYAKLGLVGYTVNLSTSIAIPLDDKVAIPTVTLAGNMVTLTCATDGAAIRYTTDNSEPFSSNPRASVYTEPFAAAPGSTICAAAERTGQIASDVVSAAVPA